MAKGPACAMAPQILQGIIYKNQCNAKALSQGPIFRFVNLAAERQEPGSQVDIESLPHGASVTLAKLWGPDTQEIELSR